MGIDDFTVALASVRRFVRETVVPLEAQIERDDAIPDDIRAASRDMGLFGSAIPAEYGGLGMSIEMEVRLAIELGYTTPALRAMFGTNNGIAGQVLLDAGTDEQKTLWLPRIASGEVIASFALTEPDAGSDPTTLTTRAVREGESWVIDGTKRYITNAPIADVFMLFARTDPSVSPERGISAFLVPADTPGLHVAARDKKMGQAGEWTADVHLDGVRIGADTMIGAPGDGYRAAMRSLAPGRVRIAGVCVGMAQRLVDESVAYASTRHQSGQPIGAFQLVQGMLADSQTDLLAGRGLALEAARAFDTGADTRIGPSCAKYFCSEMVFRVADRAVQIHGGAGYMKGVAVERIFRDARLFRLYEGTSQIQQVIIAQQLLRR